MANTRVLPKIFWSVLFLIFLSCAIYGLFHTERWTWPAIAFTIVSGACLIGELKGKNMVLFTKE